MSVNVEDGVASELTIENRGKNLAQDFTDANAYTTDIGNYMRMTGTNTPNSCYFDALLKPVEYNISFVAKSDYEELGGNVLLYVDFGSYIGDLAAKGLHWSTSLNIYYCTFEVEATDTICSRAFDLTGLPVRNARFSFSLRSAGNATYADFKKNSVLIEEGTSATDYVPPRTDSIIIPDTVELHGYNGVFNTIDSDGNYVKNWDREDKTTDAAGAFSLTGYASGSKVICRNKTTGQVEVLDAAASVTTSWTEVDIEIIYQLETPVEEGIVIPNSLTLYTGQNNILFPDSKAPAAFNTHIRGQGSIVWDVITMLNNLEARIVELEEG